MSMSNMQDTNKVMLKKLKINTKLLYSGIGKLNNPNALSQDKMNSSFNIRWLLLQGKTNNLHLSSQWQIRGYSSNNQPLLLCDRIKIPKLHKQFKVCILLHQHLLTVCWLGDPDLDKEPRLCVCVWKSFSRLLKTMMRIWCGVLLAVFSLGLSAPVNSCDNLVEPITIHHEDVSDHALNTALYTAKKKYFLPCYFNALVTKSLEKIATHD